MADSRLQVVESPGPYVYFALSAFGFTLVGGPLVGVVLWMSRGGIAFADRQPALIQAHGWTQIVGWSGLFVAGFSLRLLPRFAGQPEQHTRLSLALLGTLVIGVTLRLVGDVLGQPAQTLAPAGEVLVSVGIGGVALRHVAVLRGNRHPGSPWALFAWIGAAWWFMWGTLTLLGAAASLDTGVVPSALDRATVWVATLGAVGNFIWAVQSRMVPVSFGRQALSRAAVRLPAAVFNSGVIAALVGGLGPYLDPAHGSWSEVRTTGLGVAGAGMTWLAVTCGAVRGRPTRLRPAAQPTARFIIWANRWAVIAGLVLLLLSVRTVLPSPLARLDLEDAALHAIEVGFVTMLIAGMLQLVAPIFAMQRKEHRPSGRYVVGLWGLLMTAALSRVAASLVPSSFAPLAALSGLSGWLGLAALAARLGRMRT